MIDFAGPVTYDYTINKFWDNYNWKSIEIVVKIYLDDKNSYIT